MSGESPVCNEAKSSIQLSEENLDDAVPIIQGEDTQGWLSPESRNMAGLPEASATTRGMKWFLTAVIVILICIRIYPAVHLPPFGDEGSDLFLIGMDVRAFFQFFDYHKDPSSAQARFPHLVAIAAMALTGANGQDMFDVMGLLRILFLLTHVAYLIASYMILRKFTSSPGAAFVYVLLLATSCYLASYSIGIISTGEGFYILFHLLSIWIFFKNIRHAMDNGGAFGQFGLLCLLLAVCTASKLFGAFLFVSFFGYALFNFSKVKNLSIPAFKPGLLWSIAGGFFVLIAAINVAPVAPLIKTAMASSLGLAYVIFWIRIAWKEKRNPAPFHPLGFVHFWALLTFCSFTLVLVLSPLYLNLRNLLAVFNWFNTWTPEHIYPGTTPYDALRIMVIKFGPLSLALAAAALVIGLLLYARQPRQGLKQIYTHFYFLIFLVAGVHIAVISFLGLKLPWHPIAIFPFFYLPFVALWQIAKKHHATWMKIIVAAIIVVVPADNMYRYLHWYPNGQLDGGQFGPDYIGVNKPCLITFEAIPEFYSYVNSLSWPEGEDKTQHTINVQSSDVPVLNQYLQGMLELYFKHRGNHKFAFVSRDIYKPDSALILTSPIYNPHYERQLIEKGYHVKKNIRLASIVVANIWQDQ